MKRKKKVYIISTVRSATNEYRKKLEDYTEYLEKSGCDVYLPHRDTDQTSKQIRLSLMNFKAISESDEIHIFYNNKSTGTHFDLGMAFALNKHVIVVENDENDDLGFSQMLDDWSNKRMI